MKLTEEQVLERGLCCYAVKITFHVYNTFSSYYEYYNNEQEAIDRYNYIMKYGPDVRYGVAERPVQLIPPYYITGDN